MAWQFEEEELVLVKEKNEEGKVLVVYNDDVNSFDHVIDTLVKICEHERVQAEQCTYIIHFKGKCDVKKGTYEKLKLMKEGMIDAGINAVIA
ncbi:MAG: ATP-dependent Clp protease adaptor ClpS [Reichenbachiella sp.]